MYLRDSHLSSMLLSTPLFQGMSCNDMQDIISSLRLTIKARKKNYVLARADMPCDHIAIVLSGRVTMCTAAINKNYYLTETLSSPLQIQIEHMFGQRMTYSSTFVVDTECQVVTLTKRDVLTLYDKYEIFRLNILNTLVVKLQKEEYRTWAGSHDSLRKRIVQFITHHCAYPAGVKKLKITMNTLATELGTSRLNISIELNRLQREHLLTLRRGEIYIPALETLYTKTTE